jgi:hypothetical protein
MPTAAEAAKIDFNIFFSRRGFIAALAFNVAAKVRFPD